MLNLLNLLKCDILSHCWMFKRHWKSHSEQSVTWHKVIQTELEEFSDFGSACSERNPAFQKPFTFESIHDDSKKTCKSILCKTDWFPQNVFDWRTTRSRSWNAIRNTPACMPYIQIWWFSANLPQLAGLRCWVFHGFRLATLWHNDLSQSFLLCSELATKKALSFPAKLCRFRQTFVVSDKALSFLR
jgi:hypothetical protein